MYLSVHWAETVIDAIQKLHVVYLGLHIWQQ